MRISLYRPERPPPRTGPGLVRSQTACPTPCGAAIPAWRDEQAINAIAAARIECTIILRIATLVEDLANRAGLPAPGSLPPLARISLWSGAHGGAGLHRRCLSPQGGADPDQASPDPLFQAQPALWLWPQLSQVMQLRWSLRLAAAGAGRGRVAPADELLLVDRPYPGSR